MHTRLSCKIDYLIRSNHRDRSIASGFFTDDYLDTRGSSDDGHWPCNGFTSSTVPATGLRAVGASVRPACVSYSFLINPALRSASLRPSGKLCRQSTCGAGLLRSCEPGPTDTSSVSARTALLPPSTSRSGSDRPPQT